MYKLILKLFSLQLLFVAQVFAVPDQEKFLQAIQLYDSFDVCKAKETLESIGGKNRAVFYNIGNCQYHLKNYPQAILNWRKAQLGANFNNYLELDRLVKRAEADLKIRTEDSVVQFFKIYLLAVISSWSILALQIFLFLLWILFLINFRCFNYPYKRVVSLVLFSLFFLISIGYFYKVRNSILVVLEPTSLRAGPDNDYHVIKRILPGVQLEFLEKKEIWYKVKIQDQSGWLNCQAAEVV